jgi:cellulose synthase/poly-beta-1,6-N-acetylglucosamine synthase-like glycosyltransferase
MGAIVYERSNDKLVGKGYALEELYDHIAQDYHGCFDGYFVFDADNILEPDYIENMNMIFSEGFEIVTGYRNSKNYGDNWISAGYSLWFLRESRFLNHSRSILGTSCAISGTGFLFSQRIISNTDGWHFHLLTEDIEFSIYHILKGEKIGFCPDAVLYDEQPVKFRQSWRQRMRWARGYLQVYRRFGARLLLGALCGKFSCFDMSMVIMPAIALTILSIFFNVTLSMLGATHGEDLLEAIYSAAESLFQIYIMLFVVGGITTVSEWKRIHAPAVKKLLYALTFPLFMLTYIPISFVALFTRVKWKPIEHHVSAAKFKMEKKS